jgi:transcriptional regulator with XRE-family HTH domain
LKKERQLSKELRLLGLSQKDVAEKFGITRATVSNWCRGEKPISPIMVRKLLDVGIPIKAIREPFKKV